jgi:hypothetical protein
MRGRGQDVASFLSGLCREREQDLVDMSSFWKLLIEAFMGNLSVYVQRTTAKQIWTSGYRRDGGKVAS